VSAPVCDRPITLPPQAHTLRIGVQNAAEALPVLTDLLYTDPLLTIDSHGRPSLRLASDSQWLDDGRTLQIAIRPGVKFHDGTPVTAVAVADVLRKKQRVRGFQFVTSVDTPRDGIVVIHLSRPDAFLLDSLAGTPIVLVAKPDIGTGPFKLLSREPAVRAQRNESYYRGVPGIEQIQVTTYDTPRRAWAAMMQGEVDMVTEVNRDSVEFLEGATRFATYSSIRPFYIPLVFNQRHPILGNVEVRRALAEAIDREDIVRRAMRRHGQVADDPVWPLHWAYATASRRQEYDPANAARRLEAAGFPVRPAKSPGTMPSRFQLRCLFWDKGPQYERIALLLQRQLAAIDVDLVLEAATEAEVQKRAAFGQFDTFLMQMASGKSFEYTYLFWHSKRPGTPSPQDSGYTSVDEVLDRLRSAHGDADVRVAVADLRQRFYEDVPAAFISWIEATRAVDSRFNVGDATDPEILANLWRWSTTTPQQRAAR
jgi:peptide/nickel transport system substrate-binding protein